MSMLGGIALVIAAAFFMSAIKAGRDREKRKRAQADDWRFGEPQKPEVKRSQYQRKFQLLNKSEQILFNRLREAQPTMLVFSQVSMSQIFFIGNFRTDGYRQIGEIGRKSVDFLLCQPDTSIALAIELNGPHHSRSKQMASDEKKRTALAEAGIPLLVIPANDIPSLEELSRKITAILSAEIRDSNSERGERMEPTL